MHLLFLPYVDIMKIRIADCTVQHETEHDYDTAVDLAHYESQTVRYVLELSSGAKLGVEQSHITTTRSYLEPDFEQLERGGELTYLHHRGDDPPEESTFSHCDDWPMLKYCAFTLADWEQQAQLPEDAAAFGDLLDLKADHVGGAASASALSADELIHTLDRLKVRRGKWFDAALLGQEFVQWAATHDAWAWELNEHNLQTRIANRCSLARYRLQKWLEAVQLPPRS